MWYDVEVTVIENTEDAQKQYGYMHGSEIVGLTMDDIFELVRGKCLAFNDGEYSTFLVFKEGE